MSRERIVFYNVRDEQLHKQTMLEMARRIREIEKQLFGEDKGPFPCEQDEKEQGA